MALASFSNFIRLTTKRRFDPRSRDDHPGSSKNPAEIGNECPAREIGQIDFCFRREKNLSIELLHAAIGRGEPAFIAKHDLARPKKPRLVMQNPLESAAETVGETERLGPGPPKRHVAAQNVPELRQLVQLACGEDAADSRHAIIAFHGERTSAVVAIRSEFAKLVHSERSSILSKTKLREQYRCSAIDACFN